MSDSELKRLKKNLEQRNKLQNYLNYLISKDKTFRARLLQNSKKTLEDIMDVTIPDGIKIRVLEETENTFYLLLPWNPDAEKTDELSEEYLNLATGGHTNASEVSRLLLTGLRNIILQ